MANSFYHFVVNHYDLRVYTQGCGVLGKQWNYKDTCDCFNRLYIILDGEGELYHDGMKIVLEKGWGYILPQYESYDLLCRESMKKIWISFNIGLLKGHDFFEGTTSTIVFPIEQRVLDGLDEKISSENVSDCIWCQGEVMTMISGALEQSTNPTKNSLMHYMQYKKVLNYIQEHCYFDYDIQEMATDLGMSEYKLQKEFQQDLGYTLKAYMDNQIINNISSDLLLTDSTLKELAVKYHFSDPFYLSRYFKKHMGIAPKYYKKRYQQL